LSKANSKIDWDGPSAAELLNILEKDQQDDIGNTTTAITDMTITDEAATVEVNLSKEKDSDRQNNPDGKKSAQTPEDIRGKSSVYMRLIRDYLEKVLDGNPIAYFKISQMTKDLGINPKTIFKYLKILRQSEYEIKREQFGTTIRKRGK
jgi:hypothetical protein